MESPMLLRSEYQDLWPANHATRTEDFLTRAMLSARIFGRPPADSRLNIRRARQRFPHSYRCAAGISLRRQIQCVDGAQKFKGTTIPKVRA